jgi:uncharacterized protein (DUF2267 family)
MPSASAEKSIQPATAEIAELATAGHEAGTWVGELKSSLGWRDAGKAYLVLRATLHALRDQLPHEEAIYLGAELPVLLRGIYYDGWHLHERPISPVDGEEFLSRLHEAVHRDPAIDPEQASRAVFALLAKRLPESELEEVKAACPASLRGLWSH